MKLRPEALFNTKIPSGCLLYGNNPAIEDLLVLETIPHRLNAKTAGIKTFAESELLAISKERLYLETSLFDPLSLYVVRDVTDKFLPLIETYSLSVPIVLIGKNLRSNSKIVTYMSSHTHYSAVSIYGDEPQFLSAYIHFELSGYQLEPGAAGVILHHLNTFSAVREQIKLLKQLYPSNCSITQDELEKALIPPEKVEVFKVAEAVVSKNPKAMISVFQNSEAIFQQEMIPLLRIIAKQLWDLLELCRKIEQGASPQLAVNQATPMIPFNRRPQIVHNLAKWTTVGLLKAIVRIDEMEIIAKQPRLWSVDQMERAFLQMVKL